VLGDREIDAYAELDHDQVTTDLSDGFPPNSPEGFGCFLP
jgi:hypothetical protein